MKIRDFLFGDIRAVLPVNKPIDHTVPLQHVFTSTADPIRGLPIVRKCIGYIADTINETYPEIVDKDNKVLYGPRELPDWIMNPSGEFVFTELVQQAVWSLFTSQTGLRLLATVREGRPLYMYVGSPYMSVIQYGDGSVIYVDYTTSYGGEKTIVANSVSVRRRLALPGSPIGLSDIDTAKTLLDTALAAQQTLNRFFRGNMQLDLLFTYEDEPAKDVKKTLIEQLARRHAGPGGAYRPLVLDKKWKAERLRDSNQANQVLEMYQLVNGAIVTEIFGIDPLVFALGSKDSAQSLTYQNASNLRSQVWLQAVKPIAKLISECITDYLPKGQFFQFNAVDLLRGSPSDRGKLITDMALASKHYGKPLFERKELRDVLGYDNDIPDDTEAALVPVSTTGGMS